MELSKQESRSSAGNNQEAEQAGITQLSRQLSSGGEGDDRGWDGLMASPTWWTWVWVSSRSWWWTGKPGVLQSKGSQRVRHDWVIEFNWTELITNEGLTCPCQLTIFPNTKLLNEESRNRRTAQHVYKIIGMRRNNNYLRTQRTWKNPDNLCLSHLKVIICQGFIYYSFPFMEYFLCTRFAIKAV